MKKILFVILLVAAVLRFIGTNPGYHPYHSDEGMSYSSAIYMITHLNLDPARYDYPVLIPLVNALAFVTIFAPLFIIVNSIFDPSRLPVDSQSVVELIQKIVFQYQQTHVLFWGRYLTALVSVGVVLMTYILAKKLFDKKIGIISCIFVALNFRQVLNSHLALPDIYNAFVYLVALWGSVRLLTNNKKIDYLLAGILVGASFATKFQIYSLFPLLLVHAYLIRKQRSLKISEIMLAGLALAFIVVILHPYFLIKWEDFQTITSYNVLKYGLGTKRLSIYALSYLFNIGIGPGVSIAVLGGLILTLLKKRLQAGMLLALIIPFSYFFGYYSIGGYYIRNFISITPLLLIFAGFFIIKVVEAVLRKKRFALAIAMIIAIILSVDQIKNVVISTNYFTKPWGFEIARNWMAMNIPEGSTIGAHSWDKIPENRNLTKILFDLSSNYSLAEMKEEGAQYYYLNYDWISVSTVWWINRSVAEQIKYWNKPDNMLSNTLPGVVGREVSSFAVASFVKPWQAPDMNVIVAKIPPDPEVKGFRKIRDFTFDNTIEDFSDASIESAVEKISFDSSVGNNNWGSLKNDAGGTGVPVITAFSPSIQISSSKAYKVNAWIKNSQNMPKNRRQGSLRIDFYLSDPGSFKSDTRSIDTRMSSRIFGTDQWVYKQLIVIPKADAKYMKVGLQAGDEVDTWIDDIEIFESEEDFSDPREKAPYINYQVDDNILFPFSQGGL